ncbi:MAG: hypothetical protein H0T73_01340 [Ardenticatenales bacterium]|nr:hypothetical protein [Ardenticatenales bacterium]
MLSVNDDLFGTTVAAILTLMVYSYLLRDNPLYRLAEHLLVATSVAYALVVATHLILVPRLFEPLADATARPDLLIPLVLGLFLLGKSVPKGARLGNASLGYLVGVGLALATGGALVGTLIPQSIATMLPLLPIGGVSVQDVIVNAILIVGTLTVLFSFLFFAGRSNTLIQEDEVTTPARPPFWRVLGRWFLMVTFGAIFGGMTLTYMALLVGRIDFLLNDWLLPLLGL